MGVLDLLAGIAAVILALELFVVTVIFAAACAGVWFGLRFAQKKTDPSIQKLNGYIDKYRPYERRGLGYLALPIMLARQWGTRIGVTVSGLFDEARSP